MQTFLAAALTDALTAWQAPVILRPVRQTFEAGAGRKGVAFCATPQLNAASLLAEGAARAAARQRRAVVRAGLVLPVSVAAAIRRPPQAARVSVVPDVEGRPAAHSPSVKQPVGAPAPPA